MITHRNVHGICMQYISIMDERIRNSLEHSGVLDRCWWFVDDTGLPGDGLSDRA